MFPIPRSPSLSLSPMVTTNTFLSTPSKTPSDKFRKHPNPNPNPNPNAVSGSLFSVRGLQPSPGGGCGLPDYRDRGPGWPIRRQELSPRSPPWATAASSFSRWSTTPPPLNPAAASRKFLSKHLQCSPLMRIKD
ncbi:uncharacterized protein LOC133879325 isoform X2 [Alnus glutinosa]|uniref:uncharacterized protein LOC133879325 isoform X2 n=1 Tax=Alnus glutinosa TaxID=3517 RepID=UPI002D773F2D|nr:uncharacterized protein LOC133879325 isoform X2 [Alnus glutinosa]